MRKFICSVQNIFDEFLLHFDGTVLGTGSVNPIFFEDKR